MAVPVAICDLRWKFEGVSGSDMCVCVCAPWEGDE